jgi:copper oxidase (laccase) domain-containing protein
VALAFPGESALIAHKNRAAHLDLWRANELQLRTLGVKQVEIAGICTADHTQDLYSWRREDAKTGRFAAVISLV